MSNPATALDRSVARACGLYSLPAVAMEVLDLTSNPQLDTHALKECIENDPALTGKILRVVNSSLFGLSREVSDLNQALALLGTKPLKLLVLGFSLPPGLFHGLAEKVLGRYWRHTLTKAVAGREISETFFKIPGDEAFIAGLLHDLGILVLIQELGEPYVKFLDKVATAGKDLAALEVEAMGFNHTALSAKLLAQWGLPDALVEAVGSTGGDRRSDASQLPDQPLPQILQLAELAARMLAGEQPEVWGRLLEFGRRYRDISEAQLETLLGSLAEKVKQLADVLSLQLPDGLDYRDVLVQAHAQLAAVAADAAGEMLDDRPRGTPQEDDSLSEEVAALAEAVAMVSERSARSTGSTGPGPPAHTAGVAATGGTSGTVSRGSQVAVSAMAEADPGLLGQLAAAVAACRQARCPLSLLLVQLDQIDELVLAWGTEGYQRLQRLLEGICNAVEHTGAVSAAHGEAGFALILPDCDRRPAVELAGEMLVEIRRLGRSGGGQTVSVGVGVATVSLPPKNFPADDLLAAADRCLYGSLASGGGVVKSIEIY